MPASKVPDPRRRRRLRPVLSACLGGLALGFVGLFVWWETAPLIGEGRLQLPDLRHVYGYGCVGSGVGAGAGANLPPPTPR